MMLKALIEYIKGWIPLKILNINSYYYSSSVHKQLDYALKEKNVNSFSYVPTYHGDVQEGIENVCVSNCYNYKDRFIFHLKHKKIFDDIITKYSFEDINILHAHSLFSNGFIALKLNLKYDVPYVVAVRDTDVNTFFKRMIHLRGLGLEILKKAAKIVFLSTTYRDHVVYNYVPKKMRMEILAKSYIIPNGVDDFWHRNRNQPKTLMNNKKINLLYVGLINKRKNLLLTIRAIKTIKKAGYKVNFTVVGKISNKKIYNKITKKSYVDYIGPKSQNELISLYRMNDIFIMPSKTETFGLVYVEAMSQGLPVIYSKGQGFDNQFDQGLVGYAVDPTSEKDVANKILRIIKDFKSLSQNCIENTGEFDWRKIADKYIIEYKNIMNK